MSRLSNKVKPVHYDLFFEPNLKTFVYKGKATIKVNIIEKTNEIRLHSEVDVKSVKLGEKEIKFSKENEYLILNLEEVYEGEIVIEIDFEGEHNDKLNGFYRSTYKENGEDKILLTSQMEAPYARKAFPCFDEPNMKATFDVTLMIDNELEAVSNMPVKNVEKGDKKTVKFETSPLMSTYLLYLGVGEFEFLKGKMDEIDIRIIATKGKNVKKQGEFALDMTKKFLKFFQDYSEVPYPLPKLDMLAIPDFGAGAMENWGAITYREILLLFDEKKTSTRIKKRIAEVIAHELWHMWSGNLVTMDWWDDLWLNESFATYMAYKAVNHVFPEWNIMEDFVSGSMSGALDMDMLESTHSIAVKVNSPNEIEEIFDEISYGKGGCVLRMIESFLGEENFRKGVSNYLKKFKYKNAVADDLWSSLSETIEGEIVGVMRNWINNKGYPVVEIKDGKISQKRFFRGEDSTVWKIPLVIESEKGEKRKLFDKKEEDFKEDGWFVANKNAEGFYRVKYEDYEKLKELIKGKKIGSFERWIIQNDVFSLCLLGEFPISKYLDLIKSYEKEDSYLILGDIFSNIGKIKFTFWDNMKKWDEFKNILKPVFSYNLERLGWEVKENENLNDKELRPLCISYMGFCEDKESVKRAQEIYNSNEHIDADLLGSIIGVVASNGNYDDYQKMMERYEKCEVVEEKIKLMIGLLRFKDEKSIQEGLDFSLSNKVRIQDLRTVFAVIPGNIKMRKYYYDFIVKNWNKLEELKPTHYVFMGLLESVIETYPDRKMQEKIKKFFDSKKTEYEKTKENAFEHMDIGIEWMEKNIEEFNNYF